MCDISAAEFACHFPFLSRSGQYLANRGIGVEEALQMLPRALERLRESMERRERGLRPCLDDPEGEAAAARLALYIVAATRKPQILRRFAVSEAKRFSWRLRRIPGIQDLDCKLEMARDLGIAARRAREVAVGPVLAAFKAPVAVRWTSYLKYAPPDPRWAMINRVVTKGWVILDMEDLERLMEEAYVRRAMELAAENELAVGLVAKAAAGEVAEIARRYEASLPRQRAGPTGSVPPCMQSIMDAMKAGENIPHVARFAIASYLIHLGWDLERIVDLFRSVPDFNEKITRYQLSHIAGEAGGRKRYSVPSCETMASWGLCPTNLGCGVKSPVQYGEAGRGA